MTHITTPQFANNGVAWSITNVPDDAMPGNWITVTRKNGTTDRVLLTARNGNGWEFIGGKELKVMRDLVNYWATYDNSADEQQVTDIDGIKSWAVGPYNLVVMETETSLGTARSWAVGGGERPMSVNYHLDGACLYSDGRHRPVKGTRPDAQAARRILQLLLNLHY